MLTRIVLGSLAITSLASAQPADDPAAHGGSSASPPVDDHYSLTTSSLSDDLIGVPGLRPIRGTAVEALVATGTHDSEQTSVRGTTRHGGHGLELSGTLAHQDTNASIATYAGRWALSRHDYYLDVRAYGERQRLHWEDAGGTRTAIPLSTQGLVVTLGVRRFRSFRMDHELLAGVGFVRASGEVTDQFPPDMQTHTSMIVRRLRAEHRFLGAYIDDTVRFIRGLDISGGLVIEQWKNLGGDSSITYGSGSAMEVDTPDFSSFLMSPHLGVTAQLTDEVSLVATTTRGLQAPTVNRMYQLSAEASALRPESAWTTAAGPRLETPRVVARASAYVTTLRDAIVAEPVPTNVAHATIVGVDGSASWRPAYRLLVTAGYTYARTSLAQEPRHRGALLVTYDRPRVVTATGAVRTIGEVTVIDAIAARKLTGGLSGFVAVDNLLDQRYAPGRLTLDAVGAPRMFHVGLRIDSARF